MRMEDKIGSIEVGKYADMVVFNENVFEIESHTIHEAKIYETIMNGVTRYKLKFNQKLFKKDCYLKQSLKN